MSKTSDLIFDNKEDFVKNNPQLSVTKLVPNYTAIRAILRNGQSVAGVTLSEIKKGETKATANPTLAEQLSSSQRPQFIEEAHKKLAGNS